MANRSYKSGRAGILDDTVNVVTNSVVVVGIDSTQYTPNFDTDSTLSNIPVGARSFTSTALASKTTTGGVLDAADVTVTALTAGKRVDALVVYSVTADRLLGWVDTAEGLPYVGDGSDVVIQWSVSGIFSV